MSTDDRERDLESCASNAAPYVLGALTEEESEAFRVHLGSCAICREEVASLQVVAAALPAAAPQLEAPTALKRRVMAAVQHEAREAAHAETPRLRRSSPSRGLSWRPALAGLAVAAALTGVLVGVLGAGGAGHGVRVIRAEVHAPRASALVRLQDGQAQLSISGLPAPAPNRVYEVWLKGSGAPQATNALFTVSSRGDATVGVPGVVRGIKELMVTSEPLGGSRQPTSPPVILARVS